MHQIRAPKYIKQTLKHVKGQIEYNTIIAEDFNTRFSKLDRLSRLKINKEALNLEYTFKIDETKTPTENSIQHNREQNRDPTNNSMHLLSINI
jgi:EAL domain-containing protein (putative c-di-GMP-specific phosphodiesterase class I)